MICARCQGLMVLQPVPTARRQWIALWACLCCGERIDARILANRRWMARRVDEDRPRHLWERIRTLAAAQLQAV